MNEYISCYHCCHFRNFILFVLLIVIREGTTICGRRFEVTEKQAELILQVIAQQRHFEKCTYDRSTEFEV